MTDQPDKDFFETLEQSERVNTLSGVSPTSWIVVGLGYGDEGKGGTVDWLARQGDSLVVRFNGGSQAGGNVVTPEGVHHEFNQFGSGTLAGADTFLSRFMLVNPLDMAAEAERLKEVGCDHPLASVSVSARARIVTPFHVAYQRLRSYARGGSCGRGIGEAQRQHLQAPQLSLYVGQICDVDSLRTGLQGLRSYLLAQACHHADVGGDHQDWEVLESTRLVPDLVDQYRDWAEKVVVVENDGEEFLRGVFDDGRYDNVIFEGAQGVLLDEHQGFHPYTTWSTTTSANAARLLIDAGAPRAPIRLGVTRAYMTRHGDGPFVTEDPDLDLSEPHHQRNEFQGAFRQGHLDLVALRYAISCVPGGVDGLVVTHLDRMDYFRMATSYRLAGTLPITGIETAFSSREDYERREKLTRHLMDMDPVYAPVDVTPDVLVERLDVIAPVFMASYGPTHTHKRIHRDHLLRRGMERVRW